MNATTCQRCQHSSDWHRLNDADNHDPTDPACPFRCIGYDCEAPGPVPAGGRACDCPDFVTENPFDKHTRMWADEIRGSSVFDLDGPDFPCSLCGQHHYGGCG